MNIFAWDYETFAITPACQAPPPVVFSFKLNSTKRDIIHVRDPAFRRMLVWAFEAKDVTMVAHSASFEAVVTMAYEPAWTPLLFSKLRAKQYQCTYVRSKCIRIARGDGDNAHYGLDDCLDYFGIPHQLDKSSPCRTSFGELINTDVADFPEAYKQYSLEDTIVDELWWEQERVATPEQLVDQHNQMMYDIALRLTTCRGFMTDLPAARQLMAETEVTLEEHKQTLIANAMLLPKKEKGVLGWKRPKEPAEAELVRAYAAMGREPPRGKLTPTMLGKAYAASGVTPPKDAPFGKKDKVKDKDLDAAYELGVREDLLIGNYKLDEEACLNSGSPKLLAYCRYGTADTLRGKVARLVRAAEHGKPVQGGYNVLVATGRTSSFQGEDPAPGEAWMSYGMQMQNLPRAGEEFEGDDGKKQNKAGARECFVARPGWAIVSVDYDACEMRTWAQVCYWLFKYSDLRDILNNPARCPHVEMGARLRNIANLSGVTWEQMYAAAYALKKTDKKAFKDLRGLAKGPNFGLPGGMAWARLMDYCRLNYGVVLTPAEAQNAVKVWGEIYREALPYLDWVKDQVGRKYGSRGTITQFVSKRQRGNTGYTDASNGYFQGLAADIAKCAGWRLVEQAYEVKSSALYGCRPLAFVHDEWLYEVPIDRIHEAGHLMAKIMVDTAMNDYCPDVLFTASPAAMLRWSKASGDPVFGPDKRLMVYEHWLAQQQQKAA